MDLSVGSPSLGSSIFSVDACSRSLIGRSGSGLPGHGTRGCCLVLVTQGMSDVPVLISTEKRFHLSQSLLDLVFHYSIFPAKLINPSVGECSLTAVHGADPASLELLIVRLGKSGPKVSLGWELSIPQTLSNLMYTCSHM